MRLVRIPSDLLHQLGGAARWKAPGSRDLLHGDPGGPVDWFRGAEVQDQMDALLRYHLIQPMLVVAPDASGGWLHDSEMLNQVGGAQVETYLTRTVVEPGPRSRVANS